MSEEERPLSEVVKALAITRLNLRAQKATLAALKEQWEADNAMLIAATTDCAQTVADLEADIRTRGAAIAEQTQRAPCPGTKVRSESIIVYRTRLPSGEIVRMDVAVRNQHIVDYLIDHGYTSMLKPDVTAFEKATRALPEDSRMPGAVVTWRTVVSIDSDLSPLLETEKESAPGE